MHTRPLLQTFSFLLSPALLLCRFFLPTMHFYSATSALKMPVKFLTKGCTLCILLTLLLRLLTLEKVWACDRSDLWPVIPDYHRHYYYMIYKAVMNDNMKSKQMFLNWWRCIDFLAQAVYIYRLRYSTGSWVEQVCFERPYLSTPRHEQKKIISIAVL